MSVKHRPPTRSVASSTATLNPAAASRRPAAIPAAPAPTTIASKLLPRGTATAGRAMHVARAARKERRLNLSTISHPRQREVPQASQQGSELAERCEIGVGPLGSLPSNQFSLAPLLLLSAPCASIRFT